jgi:iron complex transport system ATP-binding protein
MTIESPASSFPNPNPSKANQNPEPFPETFLEARHVHVALGDRVVLHNLNLTIRAGEHLAILGPNGCGKSTLIRTMNCELYPLIPPAQNEVRSDLGQPAPPQPPPHLRIFGRARWDLTELRRHFGVVSDALAASNRVPDSAGSTAARTTGFDAILAGFFSASTLWPNLHVTEEMRTRAAEALDRVDAAHLSQQRVGEMSAGEKRRIQIARALVHRPRQLLLDEPSNALDLAAQRNLRNTMRALMQSGIGLILVTHHLADIPPEIGRVLLMKQGRIAADGPRAALLTEPILSDLFQTEVHLGQDDVWLHSW